MKNLNFLKLALAFAMATQTAGLLAMNEESKSVTPEETKSIVTKPTFAENHKTAIRNTVIGGLSTLTVAGLGTAAFLAYKDFTKKSVVKKSRSALTKSIVGVGTVAAIAAIAYYAYTKRTDIKGWYSGDKKWENLKTSTKNSIQSIKEFGKKWFVEKPKTLWNKIFKTTVTKPMTTKKAKKIIDDLQSKKNNADLMGQLEHFKFSKEEESLLKKATQKIEEEKLALDSDKEAANAI